MRTLTPVLVAVLALAPAGCGGSSNTARTEPLSTPPATVTQTVTTPATTTTGGTTTGSPATTTGAGATQACTAADVTPAFVSSNGATGHVVLTFMLRNSGASSCHTYGYPGVEFLGSDSRPITTHAKRTTQDFAGNLPLAHVTLRPRQEATFRIVTSDVSNSPCATAHALQIIAPDDTTPMHVAIANPVAVCGGQATLSPVEPGMGANPGG